MAAIVRALGCACFRDDAASENAENVAHNAQTAEDADKLSACPAGVAVAVGPPAVSGAVSRQKKGKAAWVSRFLATQDNFVVSYSSRPGDDGAANAKVLNALDLARVCDISRVPGDETGLLFRIVTAPDDAGVLGGGEHVMRAETPEMAGYFVDGLMAIRLCYLNSQG